MMRWSSYLALAALACAVAAPSGSALARPVTREEAMRAQQTERDAAEVAQRQMRSEQEADQKRRVQVCFRGDLFLFLFTFLFFRFHSYLVHMIPLLFVFLAFFLFLP